jgi:hypothetical protein
MPGSSADRNRSEIVTVETPRGAVDVMHQESRGLGKRSGWSKFWLARRIGRPGWVQATTPSEAIRRAMLLPAGKTPSWLKIAAAEAERRLDSPGATPESNRGQPDAANPNT